jgi:hypothetical protein
MDIFDIIPTEGRYVKPVSYEECVDKEGYGLIEGVGIFESKGWLEDIREKGALYSIAIHPDGHIADGNFRYWCYRDLWEETKDWKWRFIPVDIWCLTGIYKYGSNNDMVTCRMNLLQNAPSNTEKKPVIPNEKELKEYPDETLGHGSHGFSALKDLVIIGLGVPQKNNEIIPDR